VSHRGNYEKGRKSRCFAEEEGATRAHMGNSVENERTIKNQKKGGKRQLIAARAGGRCNRKFQTYVKGT